MFFVRDKDFLSALGAFCPRVGKVGIQKIRVESQDRILGYFEATLYISFLAGKNVNQNRNPRPGGYSDQPGIMLDFRNKLIYNWGSASI